MDEQYRELTKLIRQIEVEELRTGKYPHLRPNRKKGKLPPLKDHDFSAERYRVNFLFRKGIKTGNNNRNLEIGRTEIMIEYRGNPKENINEGYLLQEFKPIRVGAGNYLESGVLMDVFSSQNKQKIFYQLKQGEYKSFVKETLKEINKTINYYKIIGERNKQVKQYHERTI